mmetsp:Transcript_7485/g.11101  ORF Transcript_7485/g.11101 Transcript_7485/m.11101 type:complete len:472 (+) Transcript_7485:172-1587(+)
MYIYAYAKQAGYFVNVSQTISENNMMQLNPQADPVQEPPKKNPPPQQKTEAATRTASNHDERKRKIRRFLAWMRKHGAVFTKNVTLEEIPKMGLGMKAYESLKPNERYLYIPKKLLISHHLVKTSPSLASIFTTLHKEMGASVKYDIMFYLLHHRFVKGRKSFWKPYLDILPQDFPNSPIFWNDADLSKLEGSPLHSSILNRREQIRRQYEAIKQRIFERFPHAFPPHLITLKAFMWAEWVYSSRLFFIEGANPREHLVPLADMVNCEEPVPMVKDQHQFVQLTSDRSGDVELRSNRAFQAGDQVFESYGYKSNGELLQYEGFLIENNPNDCVWINIPLFHRRDALQRLKLSNNPSPEYCFSPSAIETQRRFPQNSIALLRFYAASDDDVAAASDGSFFHRPQSTYHERETFLAFKGIVQRLLDNNPFHEQSMRSYARSPVPTKLAVSFRVFEKQQHVKLLSAIQYHLDRF